MSTPESLGPEFPTVEKVSNLIYWKTDSDRIDAKEAAVAILKLFPSPPVLPEGKGDGSAEVERLRKALEKIAATTRGRKDTGLVVEHRECVWIARSALSAKPAERSEAEQSPIAWAVKHFDSPDIWETFPAEKCAEQQLQYQMKRGTLSGPRNLWDIFPIYRHPAPVEATRKALAEAGRDGGV